MIMVAISIFNMAKWLSNDSHPVAGDIEFNQKSLSETKHMWFFLEGQPHQGWLKYILHRSCMAYCNFF